MAEGYKLSFTGGEVNEILNKVRFQNVFETCAEMKAYPDTEIGLPSGFICSCNETNCIYIYNSENEVDETTGKFRDVNEELKKSVSDGKSLIASAITEKGVETATDATFQTMVDNIKSISAGRRFASGSSTTHTIQNDINIDVTQTISMNLSFKPSIIFLQIDAQATHSSTANYDTYSAKMYDVYISNLASGPYLYYRRTSSSKACNRFHIENITAESFQIRTDYDGGARGYYITTIYSWYAIE